MEVANFVNPKLTVLIPALRGYKSVVPVLDAWEAQTCRQQLEILIVVPTAEGTCNLLEGQRLVVTGTETPHLARAIGIRHASAPYLMLAEDHCLPDPDWAERILPRLQESWDGVGCALRPGNVLTLASRSSFLLAYGQWLEPAAGPTRALPGHNVVWRAEVLAALEPRLEDELLVLSLLSQRLQREGKTLTIENRAKMRHFDRQRLTSALLDYAAVGLAFGAVRTREWAPLLRGLYSLAAPLIAALHWRRAQRQFRRAGRSLGWSCLLGAAPLALAWGIGESAGALLGISTLSSRRSRAESKPVTPEVLATTLAANASANKEPDTRPVPARRH